jgi:hypothetical protein
MPGTLYVAIVDQSTKDPGYGASSAPVLEHMADALTAWLNSDLAGIWGGLYAVRYCPSGDSLQPNEAAAYLVDSLPDVPGAAAYHDRLPTGMPVIYVALDEFDCWLSGGPSNDAVSAGLGHELAETAGDPGANRWADRADGTEEAFELCDRVQGGDYAYDSVNVPNFLLPSAFDPGAPGPFDFKNALTTVTGVTSGGYVILRQQGGSVGTSGMHVVTGIGFDTMAPKKYAAKRHHSSRAYRRGLRLP